MNYQDIAFATFAVGSLTVSALMFAYQKISDAPEVTEKTVTVSSQDARLSRIEKKLDEAVAVQEVMIKRLEVLQGERGAYRDKQDED